MIYSKLPYRIAVSLFILMMFLSLSAMGQDANPPETPPYFYDTTSLETITICQPTLYTDTIKALDSNFGQIVTINLIAGSGEFSSTPGNMAYGYYSFMAESEGSQTATFMAKDDHGDSTIFSKTYIVEFNQPPTATASDTSFYHCDGWHEYYLKVVGSDPDGDELRYKLISGPGSINVYSGWWSFGTSVAGQYCMTVEVSDDCSADTVSFCINIIFNDAPYMDLQNLYYTICTPDTICFDVEAFDSNPDDTVEITMVSGPGVLTMTGNGLATVCFLPNNVDSADYIFTFEATDQCLRDVVKAPECPPAPIDTLVVTVVMGKTVSVDCPLDEQIFLCEPGVIERAITFSPASANITVEPFGTYNPTTGMISFNIENSGTYEFTVIASESEYECGADTCSFTIDVSMNIPPIITKGDTLFYSCYPLEQYTYDLSYYNAELTAATFSLRSEFGSIDYESGLISFVADTTGLYCFDVVLTDDCGATDNELICITVDWNNAPIVLFGNDSTITGCDLGEICIPVTVTDIDNNLISINSNYGFYSDGKVCFSPDTSGTYMIIVTAMDECEAVEVDTIMVDVELYSSFVIECPENQTLFICEPDTLSFDIGGIPAGATVTVNPPSAWYDAASGQIRFYTNCSIVKNITVSVSDECGTSECNFTVSVTMNSAPLVIMPPDSTLDICSPQEVCLPVGISDIDNNVELITVSSFGYYNEMTGEVCFTPEESGAYMLMVMATDVCGMIDIDSSTIYVYINQPPMVTLGNDTSFIFCEPIDVCLPVGIFDFDNNVANIAVSSGGTYNSEFGTVCVYVEMAGEYRVIVTATDSCGAVGVDTAMIIVGDNNPPVVVSAPDSTIFMCDLAKICFPVDISDDNGSITGVNVIGGTYSNGFVCFTPTAEGSYTITTTAFDDCGNSSSDSTTITVVTNNAPIVTMGDDVSIFLCDMEEICVDVNIHDDDGNIMSVSSNMGHYDRRLGKICFLPDGPGVYNIIVTASDSCYEVDKDTVIVEVTTGETAIINNCPESPIEIGTCEGLPVTYQFSIYPTDAVVTTTYGTIENGFLSFVPDTSGTYTITVTAESSCGTDECTITFIVNIGEKPELSCPLDTAIELCGADQICIWIGDMPPYTNIDIQPIGYYNEGQLCFNVDSSGHYEFTIIAATDCGADTCSFAVDVAFNGAPEITTIDTTFFGCESGQMLLFIKATDNEQDVINYELISDNGTINSETGTISFSADTAGTYCFMVVASDFCGADTADICMTIEYNTPPTVTLPNDQIFSLCEATEICLPLEIGDIDNNIHDSIMVDSPFYLKPGLVCFVPDTSGIYTIIISATDDCDAFDADTVIVTVILNLAPYISAIESIDKFLCGQEQICIDYEYGDIDFNILSISSNFGSFNAETGQVCFTPDTAGTYIIKTTISDSCYLTDMAITTVNVTFGESVEIYCPIDPLNIFLCEPQEYCFDIQTSISNAEIITSFGTISGNRLCFMADTSGIYYAQIIATAECGADTCYVAFDITVGETVDLACPDYEEVFICAPQMIERQISVYPQDAQITLIPSADYNQESGMISFYADMAGLYEYKVIAQKDCSADTCTFSVKVDMNQPPMITKGDTAVFICNPFEEISYDLSYHDADMDPAIFSLTSGYGSINSLSGLITFQPDTAGVYCFEVILTDVCNATDSKTICIAVDINTPPVVESAPDDNLQYCSLSEICIPVNIYDNENNIISITTNMGAYSDGTVCFIPDEAGDYVLITTATDECGAVSSDTTVVTIYLTPPISIDCPSDTSINICNATSLCFSIGEVPDGATVKVFPPSAWYDHRLGTVCFYTNCSVEKELTIIVSDDCSADTCSFKVNVTLNTNPLVIMPPDTSIVLCEPEEICLPVGIADKDNNLFAVEVSAGAYYNATTGRVCFTPSEEGNYTIIVMGIDECGGIDIDSTRVNVIYNDAPTVMAGADFDITLCELSEICFPVQISDINGNLANVSVSPNGYYNPTNGTICFTPTRTGQIQLTITVTDKCGVMMGDILNVNVSLNHSPTALLGDDITATMCERELYCIPFTYNDIDGNIASVEAIGGTIDSGSICLETTEAGNHALILIVTDSCGMTAVDTAYVNIIKNSPPVVTSDDDLELFQCDFEEICINVSISDAENNINTVVANFGIYNEQNGQVCFTPDSAGVYTINVTATDYCSESSTATTNVTVITGPSAEIICPVLPLEYFPCGPQMICYNLNVIPEGAIVTTSFGSYENGLLCFFADTTGTYIIDLTAEAGCGSDQCSIQLNVTVGQSAQIECPDDTMVFLCQADNLCIPIRFEPDYAEIGYLSLGEYVDGAICFNADTAGIYNIDMIAATECGADTCNFNVTVKFNQPPMITKGDSSFFTCDFSIEYQYDISYYDPDGDPAIFELLSTFGTIDPASGMITYIPDTAGMYCFNVKVSDTCGASAVKLICLTISTGDVAEIECPAEPFYYELCDPTEICIPIAISPESAEISVTGGIYADGELCFMASAAGTYNFTIIASEVCGADTCHVSAVVTFNNYVNIICPDLPITVEKCAPGDVSVLVPITPNTAELTITPFGTYNFNTRLLTFHADTSGQYKIQVTAETPCNSQTCEVTVNVIVYEPPVVECPGSIDTLICLGTIDEICFNVNVSGTSVDVTVKPAGTYSGNMVCVPVTGEGVFTTTIIAASNCGADTCQVNINITANDPPVLTLPVFDMTIPYCQDDTNTVCIDGIFASDNEGDALALTMTAGPGVFT
ncbi:MAG: hypothetical protein ABIJ45_07870, partial [Candidatus Zixiibacteriota bacterium]